MKIVFFFLFALLAAILCDGYMAGDEAEVYRFVQFFYQQSDSSLIQFLYTPHSFGLYLQHHLLWFFLQFIVTASANTIASFLGFQWIDELRNWLVVYPLALAACTSIPIAYYATRLFGIPRVVALLCTGLFYFGGSAIGLLTGGFMECLLLLVMAIRLMLLAPGRGTRPPFLLALVDFAMVAAKLYSLVFVVAVLPVSLSGLSKAARYKYLGSLFLLCVTWFLAKANIPVSEMSELLWGLTWPGLSPSLFLTRLGEALFSFSYGLLWTTPLVLLCALPKHAWNSDLVLKLLGVLTLQLIFCLYPAWHGAAGTPGQRYIIPFMVALIPDMSRGLQALTARSRAVSIAVLAGIVLFLPAIEYRNSLADAYADRSGYSVPTERFGWDHLPMLDWSFHPGIFAWRVAIAKQNGNTVIPAALSGGPQLNPEEITPITGISRVILALNRSQPADLRLAPVRQLIPMRIVGALELLRASLVVVLLAAMGTSIYRVNVVRAPRRAG